MRRSESFIHTRREQPSDAESRGIGLLMQAGLVEFLGAGIFQYLPLGTRVVQRIEQIMREEMNAVGGQEVRMPVVTPASLWQESGRWSQWGPELLRTRDRGDREVAVAPTHEESVTAMVRDKVQSYRGLPFMLYQIQTKFRDEPRSRGGLIRVREFTMKDGYSFHRDKDSLDEYYPKVHEAYLNIFRRCGIEPEVISADPGLMGGGESHEFMNPAPVGEDRMAKCVSCDYARNVESAAPSKEFPGDADASPGEVEKVHTPDAETIEEVAGYLDVEPHQTAKAVFYRAIGGGDDVDGELVFAQIRGDLDIHEEKLKALLGVDDLEPATDEEIREAGSVAGYASPMNIEDRVITVVDESIPNAVNLVAGANEPDYHLTNVNYGRDFETNYVADIAEVQEGDACPECGAELELTNCIELGHIFKLGTRYSEAMDATFQDEDGNEVPFEMGCYGIGPDRLLASVVECWHDEDGILWPVELAPFTVTVLPVGSGTEQVEKAEEIYETLDEAGVDVLFDDRDERSGVKFNDAELLGIPLFVIVGPRGLDEGTVDLQRRVDGETEQVPLDADIAEAVRSELDRIREEQSPREQAVDAS